MFLPEPFLFAFGLMDTAAVMFLIVYFIFTLSDLECDYLNATQCCDRLNRWITPKYSAHALLSFLFLMNGEWVLVLANMPLTIWLTFQLMLKPAGNIGVYDPTEINNRGALSRHMKACVIQLGVYLILFFIYLYCMILSLLKGNPVSHSPNEAYEYAEF